MKTHGHVTPNADGSRARRSGPAICPVCALELVRKARDPQDTAKKSKTTWIAIAAAFLELPTWGRSEQTLARMFSSEHTKRSIAHVQRIRALERALSDVLRGRPGACTDAAKLLGVEQ